MSDSGANLRPDQVEVLIPHWNQAARLRSALEALRHQTLPAGVCVIDNGSTDQTPQLLRDEFPEVRCVRLDRNYGFGKALNRGVRSSPAELVIMLNNDAVADQELVREIVRAQARAGAEMVAACLRQPGGEIDTLGVEVDSSLTAYDVSHGEPYERLDHSSTRAPLAPTGGAAGFLREAFLAVGGFDEAIFAYLEDVDLGIRMRMAGARCEPAYRAYAWHHHAATLGSGSAAKNRLLGRSRGYLLWKYGANLTRWERVRGMATDAVIYAGQAVIDRNLDSLGGRIECRRRHPRRRRPPPDPRFHTVPRATVSFAGGLRRRLARR